MVKYGGVYRSPPAPQQRQPSAILPDEVFPNPPVGNRGRRIVMVIVVAQWIFVPPPQQRRPTVTESAVEVVFVAESRLTQNRTILDHWRVDRVPQQRYPRAVAEPGDLAVTLPAALGAKGHMYYIKKTDSSGNTVTIDGSGAETIDGALTKVLATQYDAIVVQSDGSNWHIIAGWTG